MARVPSLPRVEYRTDLGRTVDRWVAKKHADGGVHEPGTVAAFLAAGERYKPKVVFDVGALHGYFSLLAKQLWPEAAVTAFEINPLYVQLLRRNVGDRVTVVHAGVSDETTRGKLFYFNCFNVYEKPPGGWDALVKESGAMKDRFRGFFRGDFTTLEDYVLKGSRREPELIKIDVEAHQAKAVAGVRTLLTHDRPVVIIELHDPEKVSRMGTTNKATVQPFYDAGYRGYWCGNFRDPDAVFEEVTEMGEQHERLSIMVFAP